MSAHWYTRKAELITQVTRADGKGLRDATLKDARKLGLLYSYSRIAGLLNKAQLNDWRVRQGIMAALTLPGIDAITDMDEKVKRIVEDSKAQAEAAKQEGINIHDAVDKAVKGKSYDSKYQKHVEAVLAELAKIHPLEEWHSEVRFAHELGVGGTIDLLCPIAIADSKSKDFDDPAKVFKPPENRLQLDVYRNGIGHPELSMYSFYISRTTPGLVAVHQWEGSNDWQKFQCLLDYMKLDDEYDPSFVMEEAEETDAVA